MSINKYSLEGISQAIKYEDQEHGNVIATPDSSLSHLIYSLVEYGHFQEAEYAARHPVEAQGLLRTLPAEELPDE